MERIIMHIDVNSAFLSWTAIDLLNKGYKCDIRNLCAVIGGSEETRSGIVLAKSVNAKKVGIKTAETLFSARKKFPRLQVFPPNYPFYEEMSNKLFKLLSKYTPDIQIASIDECYIDYGKVKKIYGDQEVFANNLKEEIKNTLGFTVNIGIANNKLCAKMASDFSKPNKIHTLYDNEIESKMYPLLINDLFGVGKATADKLVELNIKTIGDLAKADANFLKKYFKDQTYYLINQAKGIDDSEVDSSEWIPKGISNEITLIKDTNNYDELCKFLYSLSIQLGARIREQNKYANTIAVILKDTNFKRKTHQKKLKNPTNVTNEIYKISCLILKEMLTDNKVRLIGIRLDNLTDNIIYQTSLFEQQEERKNNEKIDKVVDQLRKKYGNDIIKDLNI